MMRPAQFLLPDLKDNRSMADEEGVLTNLDNPGAGEGKPNGADTQPAVGLLTQYVKDLSVENPNAPEAFQWPDAPQIDVQFSIGAESVSSDVHEVVLKITITAASPRGKAYIVDLAYCGLVGMRNLPEEQAHAFLYAEAPRLLFPFARRVVADAVRDAGFPPLMLDPIDFNGLYLQRLQARRAEEAAGGEPIAPVTGKA
jgi:preprotein translocase subunit SecB